MRPISLSILALLLGTSVVCAAECDSGFAADLRQATEEMKGLEKTRRKLQSRLDAQDLAISGFTEAQAAEALPAAVALPEALLPPPENGEGCETAPERQLKAVSETKAALQSAEAEIVKRGERIEEITTAKAQPAETAPEAATQSLEPEAQQAEAPDPAAAPPEAESAAAPKPEPEPEPKPEAAAPEHQATAEAPAALPLSDPANPEAFIRVIAQPGMELFDTAGARRDGVEIPVFSILYVFERQEIEGEHWIKVGRNLRKGPEGWALADQGVDWTNMLVMQFAPRGKRNQVLFFEEATALNSLVSGPFYERDARKLYDSIAEERAKPEPNWDPRLIAIEPQTAVTYDSKPYLLPILDWRSEMFDGATETTLLRVAALPSAPSSTIGQRDEHSFANDFRAAARNGDEFRVGVVFVIDTTISMRPFIEQTRKAVEEFYSAFSKYESSNYVSFGLVGFRDNIAGNPEGLEYVTKVFQPLDPEAKGDAVLSNIGRVEEAGASTKGFAEDALAGLNDAIEMNDWEPYDARLVVLITDASARVGQGAKYPDMTVSRLRERARQQGITIIPLHLLTPANAGGDAAIARDQYGELAATGDIGYDKYIAIDATSDEEYGRTVSSFARRVASSIMVANGGELVLDEADEPVPEDLQKPENKIAEVVGNEIFRAQLESLGQSDAGAAPAFLSGWAADRDLTAPELETLEVSAFLTRNQLSTLDKQLEGIIGAFRSGGDTPQSFFANLQKLAAETATDPNNSRAADRSTIEAILPAFLQNLPYRSPVLRLDQAYWSSMSVAQQQEFIEDLENKRKIYSDIFGQTKNWADLGAGDPGLEATPIRLIHLP